MTTIYLLIVEVLIKAWNYFYKMSISTLAWIRYYKRDTITMELAESGRHQPRGSF